jgi:hypothetical protein
LEKAATEEAESTEIGEGKTGREEEGEGETLRGR